MNKNEMNNTPRKASADRQKSLQRTNLLNECKDIELPPGCTYDMPGLSSRLRGQEQLFSVPHSESGNCEAANMQQYLRKFLGKRVYIDFWTTNLRGNRFHISGILKDVGNNFISITEKQAGSNPSKLTVVDLSNIKYISIFW